MKPATTATATPVEHPWLDFHPHIDLIQLPIGHPGLNELPYVRGTTHPQMPQGCRWSFPAYIDPRGAQTQLVAALNKSVDQACEIQVLNARTVELSHLVFERDDHIERLLVGGDAEDLDGIYHTTIEAQPNRKNVDSSTHSIPHSKPASIYRRIKGYCTVTRQLKRKRAELEWAQRELEETLEAVAMAGSIVRR